LFIFQSPPNFGLANFYIKSKNLTKNSNRLTDMVYNRLNENGVYLNQTKMRGQNIIRFVPGSQTMEKHVDQFCELLLRVTREVVATATTATTAATPAVAMFLSKI
jgi:hypothetical protein